MEISHVIWLDEIGEKIQAKHGVAAWEVEDLLLGGPEFRRGARGARKGEATGRPDRQGHHQGGDPDGGRTECGEQT